MGLDDIHCRVLKETADVVAELPPYLKNKDCLVKSPVTGKRETLLPFFKKGRKEDLGNYRLMSLTSVPGIYTN